MTPQLYATITRFKQEHIPTPGRVLEVGAMDFNGSVRPIFTDASEYVATDMLPGRGVDLVVNGHDLVKTFGRAAFDTVICCETLEHDDHFWLTIRGLHEVAKPHGTLIISTPGYGFPEHRYPHDYYRYGQDAYREIFFAGFTLLELVELTDAAGFPGLAGIGRKP